MNNVVVARLGIYLGNMTNNESEYSGALTALKHIRASGVSKAILRLDSLLVVRQITGEWRCKALHLTDFYEQALQLIRDIRSNPVIEEFKIELLNLCLSKLTEFISDL